MTHKFSPTFMSALIGMSVITYANAQDTIKITPETIKEIYQYESKFPGATVKCYQAGKEIVNEPGLQDLSIRENHMTAKRLDGSWFTLQTFQSGSDVFCTVINRKENE